MSVRMEPDTRVPILGGESMKDFKTYERLVKAHVLSISARDAAELAIKKKAVGPSLYKNLLTLNNSVSVMIESVDLNSLATENGADMLLTFLKMNCFKEGALVSLPRVYRKFYQDAVFRRGPSEPMAAYISASTMAKNDLEVTDPGCKVSECEMAYWLLEHSGLDRTEKKYVLGRAGETYKLEMIRSSLENLCPHGSERGARGPEVQHQGGRKRFGRQWGYTALDDDGEPDEEPSEYEDDVGGNDQEWEEYVAHT